MKLSQEQLARTELEDRLEQTLVSHLEKYLNFKIVKILFL